MIRLAAVAVLLALVPLASAGTFTADQRAACKGDYDKLCKGTLPGGGRVLGCLNKHHDALSDACKKVVDAQKQ